MLTRLSIAAIVLSGAAFAVPITYTATLSGTNEIPANGSTATGSTQVTIDTAAHTLAVIVNWSGLTGGAATAGHIHCCSPTGSNVGVAVGFTSLPNTSSATYFQTFDTIFVATYSASFVTNFGSGTIAGAEAALAAGLASGQAYVNLHNATFPGGEIRGNLALVPEPSSYILTASALALLLYRRRRSE